MRAHKRGLSTLLLLFAGASVSSCAYRLVESQPILASPDATDADRGGLIYSLPMTLVSVTGTIDDKEKVSYTIAPSLFPDPSARYRLKYHASGMTDDNVNITVDKNGLLTTSKADATDRTGDIIVAIAKTVAAAGSSPSASSPAMPGRKTGSGIYPFTAIYSVDELIDPAGVELPDAMILRVDQQWIPRSEMTPAPRCTYSVCFRTVFPVHARIAPKDKSSSRAHEFAFVAVNRHHVEGIDLRSATMVARTNNVTFESGLVTGVVINQPSTALAIASLPLTVLKAILAVPSELLTLKIKNVENEASLVKAQADLLTQMKAVLDAQQALLKARSDASQAAKPTPVAGTGSAP